MLTATELLERINVYVSDFTFRKKPAGLYEPIRYALSLGGKRIRPMLMLMAYNLYKDDVESILSQAAGIEMYHNYSLLHDDLMDQSDVRRGKPTVHKKWNESTAILSGDAMLVLAYKLMSGYGLSCLDSVMRVFTDTAMEICEGQQMDMDFEKRMDVYEHEYLEMIRLKTSVLLACSLKVGALMAGAPEADVQMLYDFGINLGIAYQLKDDLLDVYGDAKVFGKPIGGDILSNKKTYLLIQALRRAKPEQAKELKKWITAEQYNPEEKIKCVTDLFNQIGVKDLCEDRIEHYTLMAELDLQMVQVPEEKKTILKEMMHQLMHREV